MRFVSDFSFATFFALVAAALSTASCLTPPGRNTGLPGGQASPADPGPRPFSKSSTQLFSELKIGWNLGNSLDVPDGETAWGNPRISQELLNAVSDAGFDLVRIPVTWSKRMGPAPNYELNRGFLERVSEVVGYARAAGLHVVVNVHHDGADGFAGVEWLTLNDASGKTTKENDALVKNRFVRLWKQLASYFQGYGEELLFESMNEIHDGYGNPDPRHMAFINELNQAFVDVVRASGGNNLNRHLVVPGYNTNIDHTLAGFELPKDPTPDHLVLSVHYYDPYLFALQAQTNTWGNASPGHDDWGQEDFVIEQFDKLRAKFVDRGVPVLMGEYGATHQRGFEEYRRYYMEYVTKAAVDRGITPVYWDNGGKGSGGEKFALFDRENNSVLHPGILEAMMRAATSEYSLSDVVRPRQQ